MPAESVTQPDPGRLIEALALREPLIGLYDAPDPVPFAPLVEPGSGGRGPCVFAFRRYWQKGQTLHLTTDSSICGGARRSLCAVQTRSREDFVRFLYEEEGLRASREQVETMIETSRLYAPEHPHVLIGPLAPSQYAYLKTVTFYVNPDQLSVLQHGAYYNAAPGGPPPVIVPFGSGCGELISVFADLGVPQAAIGSTDIAMRDTLPPDLLAFTTTKRMFEQLCALDERSFLGKGFLRQLRKARAADWGRPWSEQ